MKGLYVSIFCLRDFWLEALTFSIIRVRFFFLLNCCLRNTLDSEVNLKLLLLIVRHGFRCAAPFLKTYHVGGNSFPERLVPFGFLSSVEFLFGELDREPVPFPLVSQFSQCRVSFHTSHLGSIDHSSSIVCNLQEFCCICPWTCLRLQQRQKRLFQILVHDKRNAFH